MAGVVPPRGNRAWPAHTEMLLTIWIEYSEEQRPISGSLPLRWSFVGNEEARLKQEHHQGNVSHNTHCGVALPVQEVIKSHMSWMLKLEHSTTALLSSADSRLTEQLHIEWRSTPINQLFVILCKGVDMKSTQVLFDFISKVQCVQFSLIYDFYTGKLNLQAINTFF